MTMKEKNEERTMPSGESPGKEPGFLGRLIRKLDEGMKQKAEQKHEEGGCCGGGGQGKGGGKCC